jgi:mannose-1-phosphate guanylyltransferase / mannose-6-phosphate isomerase
MPSPIVPVILSGGGGQRLWPLSTPERPKQFHALGSTRTLIQETALRVAGRPGFGAPVVICNADHVDLVRRQLDEVGVTPALVVVEPVGRNTAAAAAVAARITAARFPGALSLLLPADHRVGEPAVFHDAISAAAETAQGRVVVFGITPRHPETGYGYIEAGEPLAPGVHVVRRFVEKPDRHTAERYLAEGGYLWNAGVFLFAPEVMLAELDRLAPEIVSAVDSAIAAAVSNEVVLRLDERSFAACPSAPIDTAVMEKTALAAVAPCAPDWADVGSWSELWRLAKSRDEENAVAGPVTLMDVGGSLVWSEGPAVGVLGLQDVIVVATSEGVLVAPRSRDQDVKALLARMKPS